MSACELCESLLGFDIPVVTTLPGTTASGWEVGSDLAGTRTNWRWHGWDGRRKSKHVNRSTISTNIVLVGSELTTLSGDALEILLGRGVRIANLEKKTFLTNWLAMELLDDLLTYIATLKAVTRD